jgi:hypothetical protein
MATCNDCLHFIVCEALEQGNGIKKVHPIQCGCFKDKANFVKVVMCKDCKHWGGITFGNICRRWTGLNVKNCTKPTDFCSYGELKECEGK